MRDSHKSDHRCVSCQYRLTTANLLHGESLASIAIGKRGTVQTFRYRLLIIPYLLSFIEQFIRVIQYFDMVEIFAPRKQVNNKNKVGKQFSKGGQI